MRRRPALLAVATVLVVAVASAAAWIAFAPPHRRGHPVDPIPPSAPPPAAEAARQASRGDVAMAAVVARSEDRPATPGESSRAVPTVSDVIENRSADHPTTQPARTSPRFQAIDVVPEDLFTPALVNPRRPFDLGEIPRD
jgi:hypothetical protein